MNGVKGSKVWTGCEECESTGIPPLRLMLNQVVGDIQQAPAGG